jgi:hypothetical protein
MESSNVEMAKRLKYTKDILTHMLGQKTNNNEKPSATGSTSNRMKTTGAREGAIESNLASTTGMEKGFASTQGFNKGEADFDA